MIAETGTMMPNAFDLNEEIDKKIFQGLAILRVICDGRDTGESIKDSLWAVDDLVEDAKKGIDALYEQIAEKGVRS